MSPCEGENCTHPDCTHETQAPIDRAELDRQFLGYAPEKWARMNRAERRAALKGKGRRTR